MNKIILTIFTMVVIPVLGSVNAETNSQQQSAYFYSFEPEKCFMSFDGFGKINECYRGVISVAVNNPKSVNVSLISELGVWQIALSKGDSIQPQINRILIRSLEGKRISHYSRNDNEIIKGACSSIRIKKNTSGNCSIKLSDGRQIVLKFETDNLRRINENQIR